MRFLKTFGLLALLAAVCKVTLLVLTGPMNRYPGYKYETASQMGEETGGAIMIFLVGAVGAGIVAFVTRKQGHRYPGLRTGMALILLFAALLWVGRLAELGRLGSLSRSGLVAKAYTATEQGDGNHSNKTPNLLSV